MRNKSLLKLSTIVFTLIGLTAIPTKLTDAQRIICNSYGQCFLERILCDRRGRCYRQFIPVRTQIRQNQVSPNPSTTTTSGSSETQEMRLYQLVNQYRAQYGLPAIPLSPSLSYVARSHVRDLYNFDVDNCRGLNCPHGWSNCAYDANNRETLPCMWEAPQRLGTSYPGNGYEILATSYGAISPEQALQVWQRSPGHNGVIINQNPWNQPWNAMGVGINGRYAAVWFGKEPDPAR